MPELQVQKLHTNLDWQHLISLEPRLLSVTLLTHWTSKHLLT